MPFEVGSNLRIPASNRQIALDGLAVVIATTSLANILNFTFAAQAAAARMASELEREKVPSPRVVAGKGAEHCGGYRRSRSQQWLDLAC
jgi:hypothetical protein